jgi:hypothetical protein
VLVAAVAGFGGWKLLGSGSDTPTPTPVTHPAPRPVPHAATIPAHGHVAKARLGAVAAPVFAAMTTSLGPGWTQTGHLHVSKNNSNGGLDRRMARCSGYQSGGAGASGFESGKLTSGDYVVRGGFDVVRNAAAAHSELALLTAPRTVACAKRFFPQMMRHSKAGRYLTGTSVSLHRLPAVPKAFRLRMIAIFVVSGHEVPVQVDMLGAAVGRSEVTLIVTSRNTVFAPSRQVAALRAMVKRAKASLR